MHVDAPNKKSGSPSATDSRRRKPLFRVLHKRKSSLVVDLKAEKGKDVVRRLAGDADIILENFRPGVMSRLKLGYEDAAQRASGRSSLDIRVTPGFAPDIKLPT
ncbi:MAG: CoA transferase [Cyanobacteriota/Melainabacteria group bacterium]